MTVDTRKKIIYFFHIRRPLFEVIRKCLIQLTELCKKMSRLEMSRQNVFVKKQKALSAVEDRQP